jgi:hypothetical protein
MNHSKFGVVLAILFLTVAPIVDAAITLDNPRPLTLTWQDNSGSNPAVNDQEDGFILERNLNGGAWTVIASAIGANITTYSDGLVVQSTTVDNVYCYRVKAFNKTGQSGYSNQDCGTIRKAVPPLVIPTIPGGVTVSGIDGDTLEVAWARTSVDATSTELRRRNALTLNVEKNIVVSGTTVRYRDNGLPRTTVKCYDARHFVQTASSEWSNLQCASTR